MSYMTSNTGAKKREPQPRLFSPESSTKYFDKKTPRREVLSGKNPSWVQTASSGGFRYTNDGHIIEPHQVELNPLKNNKWATHPTAAAGSNYQESEENLMASGTRARELENKQAEEVLQLFASSVANKNRNRVKK
mmetsp:Transcript_3816/g.5045  ORF Transcript_3816/g.5045 Transcript_3816/m.5045 type:complete len:135 (+) Transcript_3816:82-486(+)